MEYKDLVKDFIQRTNHNLQTIEEITAQGDEAYEVTQLINSLLGLLILPQQEFFDFISKDSIEKAKKDGWLIPEPESNYEQVADLSVYLRYLRNGVSHFNIEFTNKDKKITGIQIWNQLPNSDVNWKINLSIQDIKSITTKIEGLINKL